DILYRNFRVPCGIITPMRRLRLFWRSVYDVRPGEGVRTLFMALHLMFVLFAYYILKPVSRALFLNKFDIDQLPYLYVLIALARLVEPRDLLLASAVMVILSYGAFRVVAAQKSVNLAGAKAAEAEEDFAFGDILAAIRKHRHLQVIMAIITLTFIVDVMVEY